MAKKYHPKPASQYHLGALAVLVRYNQGQKSKSVIDIWDLHSIENITSGAILSFDTTSSISFPMIPNQT